MLFCIFFTSGWVLFVIQAYQTVLSDLLFIGAAWKTGIPSSAKDVDSRVRQCARGILKVASIIGQNAVFPKAHDLLHIPHDILHFGSSLGTSTGNECELVFHAVVDFDVSCIQQRLRWFTKQ